MITVRVFREMGNAPVSGKKVAVFTSTGEKTAFTDSNGSAHFDLPGGREYRVYVDGKKVHDDRIVGVQVVYI